MRYDRGGHAAIVLAVTLGTFAARPAFAQTASSPGAAPSGKVVAEALFEEGRRLVADGKYAEACPKFADSQRLDPSASTLLNLASCYEKLGRTATAWATYKEAASAANAGGRAEYVAAAQRHADGLSGRLSRLTITVARGLDGIRVERDGVVVDPAEWGTPIPVDPGGHTVTASAPGHQVWASTVDMTRDNTQVTIAVPPLDPLPGDAMPKPAPDVRSPDTRSLDPQPMQQSQRVRQQPAPPVEARPIEPPAPAPPAREDAPLPSIAVAGWVVAGLGAVSAAVGGGFAFAARSKYDASLDNCQTGANRNLCNPQGFADRNAARTDGDVATWTIAGGAAAFAAGMVMVLVAPRASGHAPSASWMVVPGPGGIAVRGSW